MHDDEDGGPAAGRKVSWARIAIAATAGVVIAVAVFVAGRATAPPGDAPDRAAPAGGGPPGAGYITTAKYRRIELRMTRARVLALLGPPATPTAELVQGDSAPNCLYYRPVDLPNNVGFRFCFGRTGAAKGKVDSIAAY